MSEMQHLHGPGQRLGQKGLPRPLEGVRVLDLTRALSGPFCTMVLADLGAEVIKVESLPGGDLLRQWGPFVGGESAYFLCANRNKKSIAIDFRTREGLELVRELALGCDVVVENFKTGTMEAMGLGKDALQALKPELVFASISGFGSSGPAGSWPGFDQIAQGYSGLMSVTGEPSSGPVRVGIAIGDLTSGMWAALGIVSALFQRKSTGRGQAVETSLLASLVSLLSVHGQRYLSLGEVPGPTGNQHPVAAPYGVFEAADGPMNIAVGTQDMWIRLCQVLNLPDLQADSRFAHNADRARNRVELKHLLEQRLAAGTRADWTNRLISAGIPAGPINDLADVFADPQVRHCEMVQQITHPTIGELPQLRNPLFFSDSSVDVRSAPPLLGEHTTQVLDNHGMSADAIARLLASGVVRQV